jgi:hypothetical protein
MEYRDIVRNEIEGQLAVYWVEEERLKKLQDVSKKELDLLAS